jgi:hypothetical protein
MIMCWLAMRLMVCAASEAAQVWELVVRLHGETVVFRVSFASTGGLHGKSFNSDVAGCSSFACNTLLKGVWKP